MNDPICGDCGEPYEPCSKCKTCVSCCFDNGSKCLTLSDVFV